MPAGTFVTTGHTRGSAGAGTTACPIADGAARLPALMVVNAPPRNVRRLIMADLPQRQSRSRTPRSHVRSTKATRAYSAPQVDGHFPWHFSCFSPGGHGEQFTATTGACNDHRPRPG